MSYLASNIMKKELKDITMIEKILKVFFDKEIRKKNITIISKEQRENNIKNSKKNEKKLIVETCLSHYFSEHRGLNLIERGHTYKSTQYIR